MTIASQGPKDPIATFTSIRDRLGDLVVKGKSHRKLRAFCPAHYDRTPSLQVTVKGDNVCFRCFAGCEPTAILEKLGMTWSDFYGNDRIRSQIEVVAQYDYV